MKTETLLEVRKLNKAFGANKVLNDLDMDVFKNETLTVIGGSGCGKSVLIKCIVGLIKPDSGSIKLNDESICNLSSEHHNQLMSRFGFLFQSGGLFDSLTVWENIAFFLLHNKKMKPAEAKSIAEHKLAQVGLNSSVLDLYPAELSGGMVKRVSFARAIVHDPEVIFFDEPTSGLDPIMSNVVNDLIIQIRKDLGATCVVITHDINSVRKIASRVAMIYKGGIVWAGDVKQLDKSGNKIFDQFVNGKTTGPISF